MNQTKEFIAKFKKYCNKFFPPNTGAAHSYANAIKYLLEFMDVTEISDDLISEIKSIEPDIRDADSVLYGELSTYFTAAGRQSDFNKRSQRQPNHS